MDFREREREMKKTLEARKIQPSKEVWEKLDKQLNQKKRKKPIYFYWSAIAAGLVIAFLIGGFYIAKNDKNEVKVAVEEVESFDNKKDSNDKYEKPQKYFDRVMEVSNVEINETVSNSSSAEETHFTSPKLKNLEVIELAEPEKITTPSKEDNIAKINEEDKNVVSEKERNSISGNKELVGLDSKESKYSSQDEVERLLADAFLTTTKQKDSKPEQTVDALTLLKEVDEEIENEAARNLREQMEHIIKDGWYKAKTAFAANK